MEKLIEPKSDIDRCHQWTEDIHDFGVFTFEQKRNAEHYDFYSGKYDAMQEMTGFNDPYELVKLMIEHGVPRDAKIIDFGCGTGLTGE